MADLPQEVFVGEYFLGPRNVRLYLRTGEAGGSFYARGRDGKGSAEILIGYGKREDCFPDGVSVLLHEATELAYMDCRLRYVPSPDYAEDSATFNFSMNHSDFSEATSRVGWFIENCYNEFRVAFHKTWKLIEDDRKAKAKAEKAKKNGTPDAPAT